MKNLNFFLKRYFLVATIFCISGTVLAQVEKEVTLTSSVNLSSALNSLGTDINTITKLTVINNTDGAALSSTDFATLNAMNTHQEKILFPFFDDTVPGFGDRYVVFT